MPIIVFGSGLASPTGYLLIAFATALTLGVNHIKAFIEADARRKARTLRVEPELYVQRSVGAQLCGLAFFVSLLVVLGVMALSGVHLEAPTAPDRDVTPQQSLKSP